MATCNKCKQDRCGCADSALNMPPNFSNDPTVCPPDSETCSELFLAECICWQGPDICELDVKTGDRLDEVIRKLILAISQVSCAQQGEDGEPGASAYDTWLSDGNAGSEQDFLISLIGADSTVPGPPGLNGLDGNIWLNGNNIPLVTLGDDDDYYLDDLTGDYYKKILGAWVYQGTLDGIQGIQGVQGPPGPPGPASITWESTVNQSMVTGTYTPQTSYGGITTGVYTSNNVHWSLTPDAMFIDIDVRFTMTNMTLGDVGRFELDFTGYIPNIVGAFGNCVLAFRRVTNTWEHQQAIYAEVLPTGILRLDFIQMDYTETGAPKSYDFKGQIIARII